MSDIQRPKGEGSHTAGKGRFKYTIDPRDVEVGGGWTLKLLVDGQEVGGGAFPITAETGIDDAFCDAWYEGEGWLGSQLALTSRSAAPAQDEYPKFQHPDDGAVDRFAAAMKAKMAASRAKGRNGWDNEVLCPADRLRAMLLDHLAKGDPVDIGNFAMMLWNRGEPVAVPDANSAVDKLHERLKAMLGDEFHNIEGMLQQVRASLSTFEQLASIGKLDVERDYQKAEIDPQSSQHRPSASTGKIQPQKNRDFSR